MTGYRPASLSTKVLVGCAYVCLAYCSIQTSGNTFTDRRRMFWLPNISHTAYRISDIVVLPWNASYCDVTILHPIDNSTVIKTRVSLVTNFTIGDRLDNVTVLQTGFLMISSADAATYVRLRHDTFRLPSLQELSRDYLIADNHRNHLPSVQRSLFIYSPMTDRLINLCCPNITDDTLAKCSGALNYKPTETNGCFQTTISPYEGLLLNNISALDGIQITANDTIGILLGIQNDHGLATVNGSPNEGGNSSALDWQLVPSGSRWRNLFVIIPHRFLGDIQITVTALQATNVTVYTAGKSDGHTDNVDPDHAETIPIPNNATTFLQSTKPITVLCTVSSSHTKQVKNTFFVPPIPIHDQQLNSVSSISTNSGLNNTRTWSQWIYISHGYEIKFICLNDSIVISMNSSKEQALQNYKISFGDNNFHVFNYTAMFDGYHNFYFSGNVNDVISCTTFQYGNVTFKPVHIFSDLPQQGENNLVDNAPTANSITDRVRDNAQVKKTPFDHFSLAKYIISDNETNMNITGESNKTTSNVKYISNTNTLVSKPVMASDTTEDATNMTSSSEVDLSNYELPSNYVDNVAEPNTRHGKVTETNDTTDINATNGNINNSRNHTEKSNNGILNEEVEEVSQSKHRTQTDTNADQGPNREFKAVVDIVKSDRGDFNTLEGDSSMTIIGNRVTGNKGSGTLYVGNNPRYSIQDNDDGPLDEDGKSVTAVVLSLAAAIVAVVFVIFVFLLIELFSKQNQNRNTRIRPFLSYY